MINLDLGDTRLIIDECKSCGVLRNQAAYILATAFHETNATMLPVEEAYWTSEDWREKNLRYYPWHGRGHVQMTWEDNYKRAAKELNIPFDTQPELALDSTSSAKVLVMGCMAGWWTGKRINHYITLQKSDFYNARRVVNGLDRASDIAKIARDYDEALTDDGYGVTDVNPLPKPTATPKVFKNLASSKEILMGAGGVLSASSGLFAEMGGVSQIIVVSTLSVLAIIAAGVVVNRLWARQTNER